MSYLPPTSAPPAPEDPSNGATLPIKNAKITGSPSLNGDAILTVDDLNKTWLGWEESLTEKIQSIVRGGAVPPVQPPGTVNKDHEKIMLVIREVRGVDVFGVEDGTVSVFDPTGLTFPGGIPCTRDHIKMVGFDRRTIKKRFHSAVAFMHSANDYTYCFGEFSAQIVGLPGGYARAEYYTRHSYEQYDYNVEIPQWNEYGEVIPPLIERRWNFHGAEFEDSYTDERHWGLTFDSSSRPVPVRVDDPWPYPRPSDHTPPTRIPVDARPDFLKQPTTVRAFEKPATGPGPVESGASFPLTLETNHFPLICWALLVNE